MIVSSFPYRGGLSWPLRAVRLAGLVLLVFYVLRTTTPHPGWSGLPLTLTVLLTLCSAGWLLWLASDWLDRRGQVLALLLFGLPGGLLAGLSPVGVAIVFPALALIDAGARLQHRQALGVLVGVLAMTVLGHALASWPNLLTNTLVLIACVLLGSFRFQYMQRAEQAELLLSNVQVAAQEHARAATLAERSRIARELHDIQAHALAALSVQLKVIDALVQDQTGTGRIRDALKRADELTREGLVETRRAILSLREEVLPLDDLLSSLAGAYTDSDGHPAGLRVTGEPVTLPTDVTMALYRAGQEALTNVRKHAPGSPVPMTLAYAPGEVSLTVTNDITTNVTANVTAAAPSTPTVVGSGYGIAGLVERAAVVGGTATAGPDGHRWRVCIRIPL
ncbi:sensor histidine kinase [Amycolatopsis sp. H20-H5]|uniref:sensor histidine kinase n=1 Tax=Amycolatopsis sp. H20-H5 TaxID=3046309 RepID=UPI002DBE45DC|nr:histidine kinase [Amycolatopsis sp. H20-H5]MEC3977432.1 histidine kinase [Amycolatopsis sp. H20-H5]